MLKEKIKNRVEINIRGVNLKRLIKNLYKNNIDVFNLNQKSHKELDLTVYAKDLKKIKLLLADYDYKIIKNYGFSFFKSVFKLRFGLCAIFVLFFVALFFNNNYLAKICVFNASQETANGITAYLKEQGITKNSFFVNIDCENLETELENKFPQISLCSIIKKGTNLLINIKEKIDAKDLVSQTDIVAPENGKILELLVVQGRSKVKVGDSVKKGDVIIEGVTNSNGEDVACKAIGKVKMQIWYSDSITFLSEERVFEKTGNKIVNSYYEIFNKRIKIKSKTNNFITYEKETKCEYLFKNLFIPIKIYKEIYYETKENLIKNDFSLQKDEIYNTILARTKAQIPYGVVDVNTKFEESDIQNGKIITCYIETVQEFE